MKHPIRPYLQVIPEMLSYQLVSKLLLGVLILLLRQAARLVLYVSGHPAVSSGDFTFLFSTWQGWLLLALGLLALCVYVVFDINVMVLFAGGILTGNRTQTVWPVMGQAIRAIRDFWNPRGVLVILYVSLMAPLAGVGVTISLTENLVIPRFITSVIYATPLYLTGYILLMLWLLAVGVGNIFLFQGVLLRGDSIKEGGQRSKAILRRHWKSFLPRYLLFVLSMDGLVLLVIVLLVAIPQGLILLAAPGEAAAKALSILLCLLGLVISGLAAALAAPMQILELTRLFFCYEEGRTVLLPPRPERRRRIALSAGMLLLILGVSLLLTVFFDEVFPAESTVAVIAHRAGGTLAAENSLAGIEAAAAHGASGCEIDVQRTADGQYVINHDSTFRRLYGVNKTPMELTLAESKALSPDVATLDEMLDAARQWGVTLYIELKGDSADEQMADDVAAAIRAKGMEEESVVISLRYPVLEGLEARDPGIQTGYLYYAAFGNVTGLAVDDLLLEEQSASAAAIAAIHRAGKTAIVWTVNTEAAMRRFLCGSADGIITDEVAMAERIKDGLAERTYLQRIWDTVLYRW